MPTFVERDGRILARVRVKGQPALSKTFNDRSQARAWAAEVEDLVRRGRYDFGKEVDIPTLGEALDLYARKVTVKKRSAAKEAYVIAVWRRSGLTALPLDKITPRMLAALRDKWLAQRSTSTLQKRLGLLSHLYEVARKDWYLPIENPVRSVSKPPMDGKRTRILSDAEFEAVLTATQSPCLPAVARMAMATGMRLGEVVGAQWRYVDIEARTLRLPITKNGHSRTVPLSPAALAVFASLTRREDGGPVFDVPSHAMSVAWIHAVKRARKAYERQCKVDVQAPDSQWLCDLHFHDIRHTAITRLAEAGLGVMELQAISGHKTLAMLGRYTHIRASNLAVKLAKLGQPAQVQA